MQPEFSHVRGVLMTNPKFQQSSCDALNKIERHMADLYEQLDAAERVVRIVAEKGFADLDDELYDAMNAIPKRDEQDPDVRSGA